MQRFHAQGQGLFYTDPPAFDIDTRVGDPTSCAQTDNWIDRFQTLVDAHVPRTGHRLKVAVLDTGVDIKHPELYDEARLKEHRSWVSSAGDVDRTGHGTHVVSTILSLTENVDVYVAKISEGITIQSTDHIAEAIRFVSEEWDVDIISLSFGLRRGPHESQDEKFQDEIKKAIGRGKVIFAAASNHGSNNSRAYPASHEGVICVHSADGLGNASLINPTALPGEGIDNFGVLGENIEAAWPSQSQDQAGGTVRKSGTSHATPVAVAIAALMIGFVRTHVPEHANWSIPPLSPAGIKTIFRIISERRKGQRYDVVSPVKAFGGDTEPEKLQELVKAIREKLDA